MEGVANTPRQGNVRDCDSTCCCCCPPCSPHGVTTSSKCDPPNEQDEPRHEHEATVPPPGRARTTGLSPISDTTSNGGPSADEDQPEKHVAGAASSQRGSTEPALAGTIGEPHSIDGQMRDDTAGRSPSSEKRATEVLVQMRISLRSTLQELTVANGDPRGLRLQVPLGNRTLMTAKCKMKAEEPMKPNGTDTR